MTVYEMIEELKTRDPHQNILIETSTGQWNILDIYDPGFADLVITCGG